MRQTASGTDGPPPFHVRLRTERERVRKSQAEFAEGCGITSRALRNYESGERLPDALVLVAAAAAFDVDAQYVLTGRALPEELRHRFREAAKVTLKQMSPDLAASYVQSLPAVYDQRPMSTVLTVEEAQLLNSYRTTDEVGQRALLQTGQAVAKKKR